MSFAVQEKQLQITNLARILRDCEQVEMPVSHHFTPGLYAREIHMPAGTFVISEIHKTEHPFCITQGIVKVWTEETGVLFLNAPHFGITKPGTRRMLITITDTIWITFHPTELTDPIKIGNEILQRFDTLPQSADEYEQLEAIKEQLCLA